MTIPQIKKQPIMPYLVPGLLAMAGAGLIAAWLSTTPALIIERRVAATPDRALSVLPPEVVMEGIFERAAGMPSAVRAQWSGFRGNQRDNISRENIALRATLAEAELPVLWSVPLGMGYAGPAVAHGCVYVLDYDVLRQSDVLRCLSLDDGRQIWSRSYQVAVKRNHGYSRTVPAVTEQYVVSIGPKGHVLCVDAHSGDFIWGIDLVEQYGTEIPLWYTGQCPLIDGDMAVLAPAGRALLIGVELATGEVKWQTPNPDGFTMSHSSVMPMTLQGKQMYLYAAGGGLVGVSAGPEDSGRILFTTTVWNHAVISPSPVPIGADTVLVTAGYGAGSMVFQVLRDEQQFSIEPAARWDKSVFACEQHTPIVYNGHIFGVLPSDAGELNRQLVCITPDGTVRWSSGREQRFGLGPFIIADDKLFVLDNDGMLTIAAADTEQYRQLSRVRVLSGRESWGPIAVAAGRMLVRDFEQLVCLDLRVDDE